MLFASRMKTVYSSTHSFHPESSSASTIFFSRDVEMFVLTCCLTKVMFVNLTSPREHRALGRSLQSFV